MKSVLDRRATQDWIDSLTAKRLLSANQARIATQQMRASFAWRVWTDRLLALTGTSLILSGIIFFFAYNWKNLGVLLKFGTIETAIILCSALAVRYSLDSLTGRLYALAASVLVGVFLIVYGQTYQTGADPWELFATWGALITPWVVLTNFSGLWAVWLALVDVTALLFISERAPLAREDDTFLLQCTVLAGIHVVALALREYLATRSKDVARDTWLRQAILCVLLVGFSIPSCFAVAADRYTSVLPVLGLLLWLIALGLIYIQYARRSPDLFSMSLALLSVCAVVLFFFGRIILWESGDILFNFLLFSIVVVAVFSGAAFVLRRFMQDLKARGGERS